MFRSKFEEQKCKHGFSSNFAIQSQEEEFPVTITERLSADIRTDSGLQGKGHGDRALSKMQYVTGFERKAQLQDFWVANSTFALGRVRKLKADEKIEKACRESSSTDTKPHEGN